MKKTLSGQVLEKKMDEAVSLICGSVNPTLGPICSNALISSSLASPYITNDGVTIASNVASDDSFIEAILEIVQEAALKTNEMVGDGTTTTLVLLKAIYEQGRKEIHQGVPKILVKKSLEEALEKIVLAIQRESFLPTQEDLEVVGRISSNDHTISSVVCEAYSLVGHAWAIQLEESPTEETYLNHQEGYTIDIQELPHYVVDKNKSIILKQPLIYINLQIQSLEEVENLINECLTTHRPLCLVAETIEEEVKQKFSELAFLEHLPFYSLEVAGYTTVSFEILEDLMHIVDANEKHIGRVEEVHIFEDHATFLFEPSKKIAKQIAHIKEEWKKESEKFRKEHLEMRWSLLEKGRVTIYVGGITTPEKRERKMRFEDCIHAILTAQKGVSLGEGLTFYKVREKCSLEILGERILFYALAKPFEQIMDNAGVDFSSIIKEIEDSSYSKVYNFFTNQLESTASLKILDPTYVLIESLKNAVSIAGMLLTTETLILNEFDEKKKNIEI